MMRFEILAPDVSICILGNHAMWNSGQITNDSEEMSQTVWQSSGAATEGTNQGGQQMLLIALLDGNTAQRWSDHVNTNSAVTLLSLFLEEPSSMSCLILMLVHISFSRKSTNLMVFLRMSRNVLRNTQVQVHYRGHERSPPNHILNIMNRVHPHCNHFLRIHFMLSSHLRLYFRMIYFIQVFHSEFCRNFSSSPCFSFTHNYIKY